MFNDPTDTVGGLEDGKYIAKIVGLDETPPSPQHPEWGAGIKWRMHVADAATPTSPKFDQDGQPFEFWQFTSAKLTPRARARGWVEAFLNRQLTPEDKGAALAEELVGKKAIIMVGPKRRDDGTIQYGAVLSVSPYVEAKKAPAKSAAVAVLEDDLPAANDDGEAF
jgi:hypothetical protein